MNEHLKMQAEAALKTGTSGPLYRTIIKDLLAECERLTKLSNEAAREAVNTAVKYDDAIDTTIRLRTRIADLEISDECHKEWLEKTEWACKPGGPFDDAKYLGMHRADALKAYIAELEQRAEQPKCCGRCNGVDDICVADEQPKPEPVALQIWCETCEGQGHYDATLGSDSRVARVDQPCPDCDGEGWWELTAPPAIPEPKPEMVASDCVIVPRAELAKVEAARVAIYDLLKEQTKETVFLVRLGNATEQLWNIANRKWPAAPPAPPTKPAPVASAWWTLAMSATAAIEDAELGLTDPASKRAAQGAAKHYRDAAKALYTDPPAIPSGYALDTKRLDWLCSREAYIVWNREGEYCRVFQKPLWDQDDQGSTPLTDWHDDHRKAIDAAMLDATKVQQP